MVEREDRRVVGFMCLTDWDDELGAASGGNKVFASERDLRRHCPCIPSCGIAEVEVRFTRLVQDSDHLGLRAPIAGE